MNKKMTIIIGGVVAAVIAAGSGLYTYQTNTKLNQVAAAISTTSLEAHTGYLNVYDPADPIWSEQYAALKGKSGLESRVNDIVAEIAEDNGNSIYTNIERLCTLAQLLETLDYKKESTKEAWEAAINSFITHALGTETDGTDLLDADKLADALEGSKELEYFSNGEILLSEDHIIKAFLSEKNRFHKDATILNNYTHSACSILNVINPDHANEILPYDELLAAIQACGTPAITENGKGGYYDAKSGNGSHAAFHGDFAEFSYSVREERSVDAPKKAYHSFHYKGQSIDSSNFFEYVNSGMEAYVVGDKVYFVSPNLIVTPYDHSDGNSFKVVNTKTESSSHPEISDAALYATATAVYELIDTYQIPEVYMGAHGMSIPADVYEALPAEAQQAYKGFFIPENIAWGSSILHQELTAEDKEEMASMRAETVLLEWFKTLDGYENSAEYVKKLSAK